MTNSIPQGTLTAMYGAVDIGGTKTLIAVFDDAGEILEKVKFPTPVKYHDFLKKLALSVDNLSTRDFKIVSVAAPGKIDHEHGVFVVGGNLTWKHAALKDDLSDIFNAPVIVENDAKAATVSEAKALAGKYRRVMYITVSTGIGAGLCVDGVLDRGLEDMEPGYMLIEHKDVLTPWEKFASGKAITEKYGMRASDITDDKAWEEIARNLASGLIALNAVVQPEIIVFGGGVGSHLAKFKKPLETELKKYKTPITHIPKIIKSSHPEEAVIYGCYEIAKQFTNQHPA